MAQIEAAKIAVRVFDHNGKYRFLATLQGASMAPRRVALEIPFTVDRSEAEAIASDEVTLIVSHKCCSHPWEVTEKEEVKAKEQMAKNLEVLAEDKKPDRYEYKVTYFGNASLSRREVNPIAPPDGWRLFSVTVVDTSSDEKLLYTWERKVHLPAPQLARSMPQHAHQRPLTAQGTRIMRKQRTVEDTVCDKCGLTVATFVTLPAGAMLHGSMLANPQDYCHPCMASILGVKAPPEPRPAYQPRPEPEPEYVDPESRYTGERHPASGRPFPTQSSLEHLDWSMAQPPITSSASFVRGPTRSPRASGARSGLLARLLSCTRRATSMSG